MMYEVWTNKEGGVSLLRCMSRNIILASGTFDT